MTDFTSENLRIELTPQAIQRREAMLPMLVDVMRDVHRRRQNRKRVTCALLMIGTVSLAGTWFGRSVHRTQHSYNPIAQKECAQIKQSQNHIAAVRTTFVQTDAESVARYRFPTFTSKVIFLDDDGLMLTLEEIGRPAGLLRNPSRTWLTKNVADTFLDHGVQPRNSRDDVPST